MGQTALVTGGSRGIGRAVVELLSHAGYQVAFSYHTAGAEAASLAQATGAVALQCDLAQPKQAIALVEQAQNQLGRLDLLVNNAGIAQFGLLTDLTLAEWDQLFAVNVRGLFLICQQAIPAMVARKSGCILNLASMWGEVGASCEVAYSATKGAVIAFSKALAKELGPSGIRVNCISPGAIETEMTTTLGADALALLREETPLGRLGAPLDIAKGVLYLAQAEFITGQVLALNGGFVI